MTAHEELALAFPFALRFGDKNSAVVPYISAAPTVAFQTSRFSSSAGATKGNAILAGGEGAFGVALGAGVVGSVVYATNGNTLYTALSALGGGLVGLAAAVFVLELHHDRNTDVSASVVPTPGGVVGGINLRF